MALVNMQQSAEEAKEDSGVADPSDAPRYPYGLELSLDEESLAKLGMTAPPAVGTVFNITAKVVVTRSASYHTQGKETESSSSWQITDMECGTSATSKQDAAANSLYGGNND